MYLVVWFAILNEGDTFYLQIPISIGIIQGPIAAIIVNNIVTDIKCGDRPK